MSEHRPHGTAAEPPPTLTTRLRALVASDTRLPRPKGPRLEPVRRSPFAACWQTRIAVRAGMPLDDFLRSRLARYVASLPVPCSRLPLQVAVEDGSIAVRQSASQPPPVASGEAWSAPLVAAEGPAVLEEATQLDVRLAMLDGEIDAARRRVDDVSHRFAADVAAGLLAAPSSVEATAEQMGRPFVRSATLRNGALAFAAAALGAETWQVALPLLARAGVSSSDLAAELSRRAGEVIPVAVFALGVAASLFALANAGLGAAAALATGEGDRARRRWLAAAAVGAAALAALVASAVATLPVAGARAAGEGASLTLLLMAVPIAAAFALRHARREDEARAAELATALTWDRERARSLGERGRRLEELGWAEDELRALERQREAARRRLRELNLRALEAARIAREAAERERSALARLAQGLVEALELDRYEFVRQATARGAVELLSPRRRKGPESRPVLEPAAMTAAMAAAPAEVEAGRLAS